MPVISKQDKQRKEEEEFRIKLSIVFYELAFHFNPHYCVEACNNLGVIYKDRDNLNKAVECYQVPIMVIV
ncbi:unnamed protein product [Lactuca virosa]|uniref:Uncharacterized protein n=1 Tax=Lactuca virosa TaxID=75947 RepID=A0AAU9LLY2_9ASTR|nr:unnamed protein product [Lactuca virosa]